MKSGSKPFLPKKKFGQHFLVDDSVVENIILNAGILSQDSILEIGPGPGALTHGLINSGAKHVTSIEIDRQFWPALEKLENSQFSLLKKDALHLSLKKTFSKKIKIVANLPYNIGSKLLLNWLDEISSIDSMVLMFQEEVAKRIAAKPRTKTYGRLSILVQWLCDVEVLFSVSPTSFSPPPKVQSSVIKITPRKKWLYNVSKENLETLTQKVFHQRRKMISTSLGHLNHPNLPELLNKIGIESKMRPEEISVLQFCQLADQLKDYL
ncbi:16S rRNA (adenine(1518)-N(6)/adenine(1519)-N(6))-dimethyltransferase RsmA [Alphaproteobacteria bacterium]|nr:16S rRNA (adenine(1518)-N(6)/adenine(1519)-N(6))-dimethyltransferase RsmA [Alphaproteobacteria bacterium]